MTGSRNASRTPPAGAPSHRRWPAALRDALLVALLGLGLALGFNALRPDRRLPLRAERPYEILVPCPEVRGTATPLAAGELHATPGDLVLDARPAAEHAGWRWPGARSLPFDYLGVVSRERVQEILATRPRRVIVYGDGDNPDSGEQLALQLSGAGVRRVFFVRGGAPALRRTRGPGGGR